LKQKLRWPGWKAALKMLAGSDTSTRNLASALALGAFVAPSPVLGLHTWMAIGLAFLFRVNRLAAFVGSNIANPLTMAPIVWLDIKVGNFLLGKPSLDWTPDHLDWQWVKERYLEAWLGAVVIGLALAVCMYPLATFLLNRIRRRKARADAG
jgi:uncharacterized protein (DUF2062 family)